MGKLLSWLAIVAIAYVAYRVFLASKRRIDASRPRRDAGGDDRSGAAPRADGGPPAGDHTGPDRPRRPDAPETMVSCAVCGLHLPGSEAVFARGRVYCGPEHRDQDAASGGPSAGH